MSIDYGLLHPCHFHRVCGNLTVPGETVCTTCCAEFGPFLTTTANRPGVTGPVLPAGTADPHLEQHQRRRDQHDGLAPKPNQTCWLCEERRTCMRIDGRWECMRCRAVS
ncbi:hypothetical protein FOS14_22120 [Skermania sp. ID1734]|uniref:hypothetical protein n=1 Tax=Skermania sp. ID1734 TaxID=2597516 RepID=UPI00117CA4F4|nr:hypothetical protein [Skermania sp. ID1734]TSD93761.1 hypothetical protein FOS14_22120 [Skermania sp. ID1734]